jgi:hypothetical protein
MRAGRRTAHDLEVGDSPGTCWEEMKMHAPFGEIPLEMKVDDIETRGVEWGDQLVRHIDLPAGVDFTPLFKGLPGDMCQCPHWGVVLAGSINVRYADGTQETTRAGEAYYWPGGHTGWTDEGVTFFEVSPKAELQPVLEHLGAQLSATT